MTLSPDRGLLRWVALWLALAVASVPLMALRPLVPAAALLLVAAVLADAWLCLRESPPSLERSAPERGARGREVEIELILRSRSTRPVEIELREEAPRDLVSVEPSWDGLRLEPGSERRLRYAARPRVRGLRRWGRAVALVRSPLGLLRRRIESAPDQEIRVHPETERFLRPEALDPKRVLAALGVRPRRSRGDGLEFDSLREYVVGDEPRRIDWRATARRGRPIVRTHRHEESRTVLLALDCSRLMGTRAPAPSEITERRPAAEPEFAATKLDHAVDAALALAFASLMAGDRVGLVVFDRRVREWIAPVADRRQLSRFVDTLSGVESRPVEADHRRVARELLARQRKRALLVVLTDFIEIDREELVHPLSLLAKHHEVLFVALREPILEALDAASDEAAPDGSGSRESGRASGPYRRIVLADWLREREERLVALRHAGLSVLDVTPSETTAATLNRFLELRYRGA